MHLCCPTLFRHLWWMPILQALQRSPSLVLGPVNHTSHSLTQRRVKGREARRVNATAGSWNERPCRDVERNEEERKTECCVTPDSVIDLKENDFQSQWNSHKSDLSLNQNCNILGLTYQTGYENIYSYIIHRSTYTRKFMKIQFIRKNFHIPTSHSWVSAEIPVSDSAMWTYCIGFHPPGAL